MIDYGRLILALRDDQLEQFVRDWIDQLGRTYFEVKRFAGPGDLGRDVVGFVSERRHEGAWHNYQCKQYATRVCSPDGQREIGKVLYHVSEGSFTAPSSYSFVAPKGVTRPLEQLVYNPAQFKKTLISEWDKNCAGHIEAGKRVDLTPGVQQVIDAFDFSTVTVLALDDLLKDQHIAPVLSKWFGADPGAPPSETVPPQVQAIELPYVTQLVGAYGEREGQTFADHAAVAGHPTHGAHLTRQRERFYAADAFKRFYRDNTEPAVLETFENDIYHGVVDTCERQHVDSLARAEAVLDQAAIVQTAGMLSKYARVPVKQGVCHHFANEHRLRWRR